MPPFAYKPPYIFHQRAPTAATRGPGDRPRPHGDHTGPRGPATPPRRPHWVQGTGHAPTAAIRGPGDRPRSHCNLTRPRGPATPPRRLTPTHIHMHNTHMHTAESVLPTVLGSTLSIAAIILIALLVLLVIVIVICVKSWLFKRKLVRLSESHFSFSSSSIGLVGCLEYPVATLLEQMQTEDPGSLNAPLSEQMGLSNQSVRLLYIPKCVC